MTATAGITISGDSTAPSGQTVALGGGPWYTAASVPLTIGQGTDGGAGVDTARGIVERASATLGNGFCGTFGPFAAVTLSSGADTGAASGSCYRYQYKASDRVGNVSGASTASADAKVDTSAPSVPVLRFSGFRGGASADNVVYYRPSAGNGFTVGGASVDGESGVASYSFPTASGFTVAGSGASRTYTLSNAAAASSTSLAVTATNGAGLSSAATSFRLVPDGTSPVLVVRCNGKPCSAAIYKKAVTVTAGASDGSGSGVATIRYTTDGTDPTVDRGAEYTGSLVVRTLTRLRFRAFDRAGNPSPVNRLTIRSADDRLVFAAPVRLSVKSGARYLAMRVTSSHRATVSVAMSGPNLKRPRRWRFIVGSGASIVRFQLPAGLARGGRYRVVWKLHTGTRTTTWTTRVVVVAPKKA
jgi:Chitobiase/beta-hexosaminidase C-terminal domain